MSAMSGRDMRTLFRAILAEPHGLWTNWTSVRKAREGEVTADIFGMLTTGPNAEVGRVQPRRCRSF
jgi:hypothetical protein